MTRDKKTIQAGIMDRSTYRNGSRTHDRIPAEVLFNVHSENTEHLLRGQLLGNKMKPFSPRLLSGSFQLRGNTNKSTCDRSQCDTGSTRCCWSRKGEHLLQTGAGEGKEESRKAAAEYCPADPIPARSCNKLKKRERDTPHRAANAKATDLTENITGLRRYIESSVWLMVSMSGDWEELKLKRGTGTRPWKTFYVQLRGLDFILKFTGSHKVLQSGE